MENTGEYLKELAKRAKESHVYRKYQLVGLEIAEILGDEKHKSLYIKLAKNGDSEALRRLAKNVAERKNIKNKGAYFMSILPSRERRLTQIDTPQLRSGQAQIDADGKQARTRRSK